MSLPHPLRSLARPDVRRFFIGQAISLFGSWVQPVAVSWLAWTLTRSEAFLGLVQFLTQAPVLLLAGFAGTVADRFPRKPLLVVAITGTMLHAALLAVFTFAGWMTPALLGALSVVAGVAFAFEIPTRQALFADLAADDAPNVVALNSTLVTAMRVVGPGVGGLILARWGEAWCFLFNALSFVAVLVALATIRVAAAERELGRPRVAGGLSFARENPRVGALLLLLAISSLFGLPWGTLMPPLVEQVLGGGGDLLGGLLAVAGLGSLLGAVVLLLRTDALEARVGVGAFLLACGLGLLSFSRSIGLSLLALLFMGFGQLSQSSGTLTILQIASPPHLRGRVLGLFTAVFVGLPPFGALALGWLAHRFDVQLALRVQGGGVLVGALAYLVLWPALRRRSPRLLASSPTGGGDDQAHGRAIADDGPGPSAGK